MVPNYTESLVCSWILEYSGSENDVVDCSGHTEQLFKL